MKNKNKDEDKERPKENIMKYYSESLDKFFDKQEDCEKAEVELEEKRKAEAQKQLTLKTERESRSKEVVEAFKKAREAEVEAQKLMKEFVKDYGSFHMSYNGKTTPLSMFDILNDFFLF